jgi:hypothetical protein
MRIKMYARNQFFYFSQFIGEKRQNGIVLRLKHRFDNDHNITGVRILLRVRLFNFTLGVYLTSFFSNEKIEKALYKIGIW